MEKVKVDELEVYKQIVLKGEDSQRGLVGAVGHMVCYRRDLESQPCQGVLVDIRMDCSHIVALAGPHQPARSLASYYLVDVSATHLWVKRHIFSLNLSLASAVIRRFYSGYSRGCASSQPQGVQYDDGDGDVWVLQTQAGRAGSDTAARPVILCLL